MVRIRIDSCKESKRGIEREREGESGERLQQMNLTSWKYKTLTDLACLPDSEAPFLLNNNEKLI